MNMVGYQWDNNPDSAADGSYTYDPPDGWDSGDIGYYEYSSLSPGHYYRYRAMANNTGTGTGYGGWVYFITKPTVLTSFDAQLSGTGDSIVLMWTRGTADLTVQTHIYRKPNSDVTSRSDPGATLIYSGSGAYYEDSSGLVDGVTYYYRAWSYVSSGSLTAYSSSSAGDSVLLQGNPSINTLEVPALEITSTEATLYCEIMSIGGYTSVATRFNYGTSPSYGLSTPWRSRTATGIYSEDISGLLPSTTYYVVAVIRYGNQTDEAVYGCGGNNYCLFTTLSVEPQPPPQSSFRIVDFTETSLELGWSMGLYSEYTLIRYSTISHPSSPSDGIGIDGGSGLLSGTTYDHIGLSMGVTYYYSAWGYKDGVISSGPPSIMQGTPISGELSIPDNVNISSALVFLDFSEDDSGDMQVVYFYEMSWSSGLSVYLPYQSASEFVRVSLNDSSEPSEWQGYLGYWGFRPGGMYLSEALPQGEYTIEFEGIAEGWDGFSETHDITSGSWMGSDWDVLEDWVLSRSSDMEQSDYYSVGDILMYTSGSGERILTAYGASIWLAAIPGLEKRCPDLFLPATEAPEYIPRDAEMEYRNILLERAQISHGNLTWGAIEGLADTFNVPVQYAASGLWLFFYLLAAGVIMLITRVPGLAMVLALPILLIGTQFGGIDMSIIVAVSVLSIFAFVYNMWLRTA